MGAKILKRCSSYKSQPKVIKLHLKIFLNGPHNNGPHIFFSF